MQFNISVSTVSSCPDDQLLHGAHCPQILPLLILAPDSRSSLFRIPNIWTTPLSIFVVDKLCVKQWTVETHIGCCHNSRQHNKQSQAGHKQECRGLASTLVIYAEPYCTSVIYELCIGADGCSVCYNDLGTDWPITIFHDRKWPHEFSEKFSQAIETISHQATLHGQKVNTGRVLCPPDDTSTWIAFSRKTMLHPTHPGEQGVTCTYILVKMEVNNGLWPASSADLSWDFHLQTAMN